MKRTGKRDRLGIFAKEQAALLIIATVFLILVAIVLVNLEKPPVLTAKSTTVPASEVQPVASVPARAQPLSTPAPAAITGPAPTTSAPATTSAPPVPIGAEITDLKTKGLIVPVEGVNASQLRDTFGAARSEGRTHEALDIMAAGGTPVLAAADGPVMKLWQSDKGGITLYQSDSSGRYIYYYAHLMRYADGIADGKPLRRGEVIGYVGDTGNAGPGNYHLHFAIFIPTTPGKWSGGIPINPYTVLSGK